MHKAAPKTREGKLLPGPAAPGLLRVPRQNLSALQASNAVLTSEHPLRCLPDGQVLVVTFSGEVEQLPDRDGRRSDG